METYDVIVIGSGIGGLISAGLLAASGLKTVVIEKHVTPGGYLSSFRRKGFIFDSAVDCISGVSPGGLIHRVLELLDVETQIRFLKIDPIRVSLFPDFDIAVDADIETYKERLVRLFPSESSGIRLFFERAGNAHSQLISAFNTIISGGFYLNAIAPGTLRLMDMSYGDMLDDHFSDYRLKAVLSDRCPFIGLPPSKVSAVTMINLIMSYFEHGACRPEGGYQRLADVFIEGIRKKSGRAIFGNGVKQILLDDNNRCKGVRCENGEEYAAQYVISNADFDLTFRTLLGGKFRRLADEMLHNPGISTSFFILYAAVQGDVGMNSSVGNYPGYSMERFFDPSMEFSEDSIIGVTSASIEDKYRAPEGYNTVVMHEMISPYSGNLDKTICVDRTIKKAESIFPDLKGKISVLDAALPSTLERYTGNCRGAAFGWNRIPGFREPGPYGIKNLYIAGHWGAFGGGVLAAAYSGVKAAADILAKEGIKSVI